MIYAIIFQEFASNPVVGVCITGQFVSHTDNGFQCLKLHHELDNKGDPQVIYSHRYF